MYDQAAGTQANGRTAYPSDAPTKADSVQNLVEQIKEQAKMLGIGIRVVADSVGGPIPSGAESGRDKISASNLDSALREIRSILSDAIESTSRARQTLGV